MNPDPEDPCYWYQKEIAEQQKSLEIAYQYRAEQDAEVERLRAELEVERTAEKMQRDKAIANYAEVRRLRADLEAERSDKIRQMDISNQQLGDEVKNGERLAEDNERLRAAAVSVVAAYGRWEIVSRDGGVNDADDAWYAVGDAIEHDLRRSYAAG